MKLTVRDAVIGLLIVISVAFLFTYAVDAAATSDVSISASGTVSTKSTLSDETCGSISGISSSTFGAADMTYTSRIDNLKSDRLITTTSGKLMVSDSMLAMQWTVGKETCDEGGSCSTEPSIYHKVSAGSDVLIYGTGSMGTGTSIDSNVSTFAFNAMGTGIASQYADGTSMKGIVSNGKVSDLTMYKYTEVNRVVGSYDMSTKFTYTF